MRQLLTITLLLLASLSFGQISEFRTPEKEFIEDVENFIKAFDKDLSKQYSKELERLYASKYGAAQQQEIVKFANLMLKKKFKAKSDFVNYFGSIIGYAKTQQFKPEEFANWFETLNGLTKSSNKKRLSTFLKFTNGFFNRYEINSSSSVKWKLVKGDYTFYEKNGAFVKFTNTSLVCYSKNDSSKIYDTQGEFNVLTNQFKGNKGTVNWERVKLPKNETYAVLSSYRINTKSAGFDADSVLMYSAFLKTPQSGKLREKVITFTTKERAQYPAFTSYNQEVEIKDVFKNIDYRGEFNLVGEYFKGGSSSGSKATIILNKAGGKFMEVSSRDINMNSKKISSVNSNLIIYLKDGETITQSLCNYSYFVEDKKVNISRVSNKSINYPYFSSFHQMAFKVNEISWEEGKDILLFKGLAGSTDNEASFESSNYLDPQSISGFKLGSINLVRELNEYQISFEEGKPISSVQFAIYCKALLDDVTPYLFEMANLGLINYDYKAKQITINPKLETYLASNAREGDYDNIFISSNPKNGENASLDMSTMDLTISGIRNFDISKRKFVRIYPKEGKIVVKKDRNMEFSGVINAGRTEYFGSDIAFDYKKFNLSFKNLDSLRLRVYPIEQNSKQQQVRLISKLYDLDGKIIIDDPINKSGKDKDFAHYPLLSIDNSPRIFYNQPQILKGVYDSTTFYFEVDPFEMDSLLTFSNSGIAFSGKFSSSDIFPVIEQTVVLMDDYVLGFKLNNVTEKIYSQSADYSDILTLNSKGLTGKGMLSFITSSALSEQITFFPDSLVAKTGNYINKSQTLPNFPEITSGNCYVTFQPQKGIWKAKNIDNTMKVYGDGKTTFDGTITLTKEKMTGTGTLVSERIEVNSEDFIFGQNNLDGLSANFKLNGKEEGDPPSLEASNMKMALDFENRKGNFASNSGTSTIEFPLNRYTASTDEFDWLMDENLMNFKKVIDTANFQNYDENKNLKPNFVSAVAEQNQLGFFSGFATYLIDSNLIKCQEIPYIVVADSRIIPKNGEWCILESGTLPDLIGASIVSSYTTKYHNFQNAEVVISSSTAYTANGNYIVSSDKSINSKVYFSKIEPNAEGITVAEGYIEEDSNFYLSPQFKYYGDIFVKGNEVGANYDGQTKIITKCEELAVDWIQFKAMVDTSKIIIPLGESFIGKASGPVIGFDGSVSFYSFFLADKIQESDQEFTPSDGFLSYNNQKGLFEIGAKEKLLNNRAKGNYISFDDENCSFKSIGEVNITKGKDQMQVSMIGEMEYNKLNDTALKINTTMSIQFPFNMMAINQMKTEIAKTQVQELIDITKSNYDLYVTNTTDEKTAKEFYTNGRIAKFPKEMFSTMTLFDLEFYWDEANQAFMAKGFANIATLGTHQIFRRCKIYVKIEKRKSGDRIGIMIEYKPQGFYYFSYKNGELTTYSTDKAYNDIIENTPAKDTEVKGSKGQEDFYYGLSSKSKPLIFLSYFEEAEGFDDDDDEDED
tara:strand:- start:1350 stop:5792 length:4443 start_codon:yes stop_codon:yes gene_type:complete